MLGAVDDLTFALEDLERLAHGDAADPEALRDLVRADGVTGPDAAQKDVLAHLGEDDLLRSRHSGMLPRHAGDLYFIQLDGESRR